jgi:endonuclease/exonuclease/phosphatase family metal-dependent hydrolase
MTLIQAIDTLYKQNPKAKIIVMGDFNDEPHNKSLKQLANKTKLQNLSEEIENMCNCGTYKYKSEWNMLDQFLVSTSLLVTDRLHTGYECLKIFNPDFLLTDDMNYGGLKLYRTYLGPRYIGGYSDHLPVVLDLYYPESEH